MTTPRRRTTLATAAGLAGLVALALPATAAGRSGGPTLRPTTHQLTTVAPYWHAGEPWGAVNPKNSRNVVIFNTELYNETGPDGAPQVDPGPGSSTHLYTFRCGLSMTVDGGRSWHYTDFAHPGTTTGHYDCIDPSVTVTRDGTFYVIYFFGFGTPQADPRDVRGEAQVRRSTDGGRTWQAPTPALTQWQWADNVGAGRAYPTPMCPPTDRVWLTSDYTTGTLYASGNGDGAAPCDEALAVTGESQGRYVVASHDGGRTWTLPAAMGQGMQAAAFGTLVVTTTSDGAAYTFKLSRDDGKTWTSHRVPVVAGSDAVNPLLPGFSQLDAPKTAADPTRRGRYAVLVPTHATTQYDVLVTDDYGRSWTRRDVLTGGTGTVTEPALAYGPRGDLAASWRLVHSDGRYDVFAVVSIDGGHTFGRAARLTSGPSPASSATLGDDCQCFVYADGTRLWTAWGDNRSGNREVFYATAQYRPARAR